jgi:hypothetical protein
MERQRECADDHDKQLQHPVIVAGVGAKFSSTSFGDGQVSARWSQDGKQLFCLAPDLMMMAVPTRSSGSSLESGTPVSLFKQRDGDPGFNVAADDGFLMKNHHNTANDRRDEQASPYPSLAATLSPRWLT